MIEDPRGHRRAVLVDVAGERAVHDIGIETVERGGVGIAQPFGDLQREAGEDLGVRPGGLGRLGHSLLELQRAVPALDHAGALGVAERGQQHVGVLEHALAEEAVDDDVERASEPPCPVTDPRHVLRHLGADEQKAVEPIVLGHAGDRGAALGGDVRLGDVERAGEGRAVVVAGGVEVEHELPRVEAHHQLAGRVRLPGDAQRARPLASDVAGQQQQVQVGREAVAAGRLVDPHARDERGARAHAFPRFGEQSGVAADGRGELRAVLAGQGDAPGRLLRRAARLGAERTERGDAVGVDPRREARAVLPAVVEDDAGDREVEQHVPALAEADVQRARVDRAELADGVALGRVDDDLDRAGVGRELLVGLGEGHVGVGAVQHGDIAEGELVEAARREARLVAEVQRVRGARAGQAVLGVRAHRRDLEDELVEARHPDRLHRLLPVAVDRDRLGSDPLAGVQEQPRGPIERLVPARLVHPAVVAAQHRHADAIVRQTSPGERRGAFGGAAGLQRGAALDAEPERGERVHAAAPARVGLDRERAADAAEAADARVVEKALVPAARRRIVEQRRIGGDRGGQRLRCERGRHRVGTPGKVVVGRHRVLSLISTTCVSNPRTAWRWRDHRVPSGRLPSRARPPWSVSTAARRSVRKAVRGQFADRPGSREAIPVTRPAGAFRAPLLRPRVPRTHVHDTRQESANVRRTALVPRKRSDILFPDW